ncbi:MAG: tRNA pseudouridine-54 N-methylase [Glaciecola sp.]|jgi:tRNA pseudouridine-54 N-methylase
MKIKIFLTFAMGFVLAFSVLASESATGNLDATEVKVKTIRLSEPVVSDEHSETFGVKLDNSLQKVSLKDLASNSEAYISKSFQVETKVAKVCQKKGCFFIAQQGDDVMRVAFKDYGFFVPTDSAGKTVTLAGELVKKDMTAEQVAHLKQDMKGESDAVKEGVVYEILADSVTIPRA